MASDELELLQAVYCGENEFLGHIDGISGGEQSFTLNLQSSNKEIGDGTISVKVNIVLPSTYPHSCPHLSVASPALTRQSAQQLHLDACQYMQALLGEPVLLDIAQWLQDNAIKYTSDPAQETHANNSHKETNQAVNQNIEQKYIALLHLDHMRARNRYIKTIQKWTSELSLCGFVLFLDHLILIVLLGSEKSVKEYIRLARTVSVDVDSHGRSCKERMLSVLTEQPVPDQNISLANFSIVDCTSRDHLRTIFEAANLSELYQTFVHKSLNRA